MDIAEQLAMHRLNRVWKMSVISKIMLDSFGVGMLYYISVVEIRKLNQLSSGQPTKKCWLSTTIFICPSYGKFIVMFMMMFLFLKLVVRQQFWLFRTSLISNAAQFHHLLVVT